MSIQTERKEEIERIIHKLPDATREGTDVIIELYGELSLKKLLDHIYAEYPEYTIRSER